jgi:hypothetical protein
MPWGARCRSEDSPRLIIPTAALASGAYSDWASEAGTRYMPRKRRGLAVIIPPVKITRAHAGKRYNQLLEHEAE